jgi:peptide chain release factor subunit 1
MIKQTDIDELLQLENSDKTVFSLYLDTDTGKESAEAIKLHVKNLLSDVDEKDSADAALIERYLDHSFTWDADGLALFSSNGGNFFRAFPSAVSFRNRLRTGSRPYLKPMLHLMEYYAHYGVILIDRVGARFYAFHLGELQASDGFMGEEVHKLKAGRGSAAVGMRGGVGGARRENEQIRHNLRDAAAAANTFFKDKPIRRLFLGGTHENVAQLRELLPKQLQSCIAGSFPIDMNAGDHEVREVTLQLMMAANTEREQKLVDQMVTLVKRGENAVTGLDDTLQAISEKRVEALILSDGFRAPGYVHDASGFVVANLTRSPHAPETLTAVDDVVSAASNLTMAQGGHIEVIRDNPQLEAAGQIGAILRF